MKTISLEIDENLYEHLMALLKQLPPEKVRILEAQSSAKNTEIEVESQEKADETKAINIHEQLMDQYASAFERLAK